MTSSMLPDDENKLEGFTTEQLNNYLVQYTWEGKWQHVIAMYYNFPMLQTKSFLKLNGTALHVAIDLNKTNVVNELLNAIFIHNVHNNDDGGEVTALKTGNQRGDTPLHIAATRGYGRICKLIIGGKKERIYLLRKKNNYGETPLFQAAINWKKESFPYLCHISKETVQLEDLVRDNGDTILHAAIQGEYFDLAQIIVHYYDFLITHSNEEGSTPLKVLATRPSAFKSTSNILGYKRILYNCIFVEQLDAERTMKPYLIKMEANQNSNKMKFPNNYNVLYDFVSIWLGATGNDTYPHIDTRKKIPKKMEQLNSEREIDPEKWFVVKYLIGSKNMCDIENPFEVKDPSDNNNQLKSEKHPFRFLPPNYETFQQLVKYAYVHILSLCGVGVNDLKIAKQKHQWSSQLLKELMKKPYEAFKGDNGGRPTEIDIDPDIYNTYLQLKQDDDIDTEDTPFLVAARNGIVEMVKEILIEMPSAIHNINSKKENALHVAVKYKQPVVVETLRKHSDPQVWSNMVLAVDEDKNTILHLAADVLSDYKPLKIPGSALQMMWDIKWFEYIRSLVPQHFYFISNNITRQKPEERSNDSTSQTPGERSNDNTSQTPGDIFRRKHATLIKDNG